MVGYPFATTGGLNQKTYAEMVGEIKSKGVTLFQLPKENENR